MNSSYSLRDNFSNFFESGTASSGPDMNSFILVLLVMLVLIGCLMHGLFMDESNPTPAYTLSRTCTTCGEPLELVIHSHQEIPKEQWQAYFLEYGWVLTDTETFCHKHRAPAPHETFHG